MSKPNITILDGGFGHLLKSKGIEQLAQDSGLKYEELFAAGTLANEEHPQLVLSAHQDYITAGADIITTNSFGCTEFTLGKIGRGDMALSLAGEAGKLARQAASSADREILVAGSLPPLMESYQTKDLYAFETMQPIYRQLVQTLTPHVDLFLCETLATIPEALASGTAASDSGKPWWISFTLEDNLNAVLRSGERLSDAVAAIQDLPGLEAVLVNCCAPQAVSAALPILKECVGSTSIRIGAYANGFQQTTSEWLGGSSGDVGSSSGKIEIKAEEYGADGIMLPEVYVRYAREWVEKRGASIVGGCCGVGPMHIQKLKESLC